MKYSFALATLAATLLATTAGWAHPDEEPVVSPDRPSFSAGASTVPTSHVQFELGADVGTTDGGAILTVPQLFVRAGVAETMELRLGVPSYSAGLGVDDPGAGTTEFGLKIASDVTDSVSIGVLPYVRFFDYGEATPVGRNALGFLGLWSVGLGETFGIFGNLGLGAVPGDDAPTVFEYAVSLGGSASLTSAFGAYLEAFITQADDDPNVGLDAGVSYAFAPWIAADLYVGAGLAGGVSDLFGGVGLSFVQ